MSRTGDHDMPQGEISAPGSFLKIDSWPVPVFDCCELENGYLLRLYVGHKAGGVRRFTFPDAKSLALWIRDRMVLEFLNAERT